MTTRLVAPLSHISLIKTVVFEGQRGTLTDNLAQQRSRQVSLRKPMVSSSTLLVEFCRKVSNSDYLYNYFMSLCPFPLILR
jgi:hypothetical protein